MHRCWASGGVRLSNVRGRLGLAVLCGFLFGSCSDDPGTAPGGDTTPPAVTVTAGSNHITIAGDLTLVATAIDDGVGVQKVEFYERALSGGSPQKIGEDSTEPYELKRRFVSVAENGRREFTAKAYDGAGNVGTSNVLTIEVNLAGNDVTAPEVALSSSHERITTPGRIDFLVAANEGLVRVEVYAGATKVGESEGSLSLHAVRVAVTAADNGAHTYIAKGYDASGNVGESEPVRVDVDIRWDWIREVEGIRLEGSLRVATDATGAAYVAGDNLPRSQEFDAFLAKYGTDGNRVWLRIFGGPEWENAYSVGVDAAGRIYVSGDVFYPGGGREMDCFLVVYDAAGSVVWAKQLATSLGEAACVATTDAAGNFYVAGDVSERKDNPDLNRFDIFVAKYDRDGTLLWTREYGSAPGRGNDDLVTSIAADASGGVYVAGYTDGSFDGATAGGSRDMFVVKFDQAGNRLWASQYGTTDFEAALGLAPDLDGGVYVTGERHSPEEGGGRFQRAILARYDGDGTLLWIRQINGAYGAAVAVDGSAVYLAGSKNAAMRHGTIEPPQGPADALLAKFASDGTLLSARLLGGPDYDAASGVAIGPNSDAYIALFTGGGLPGMPNRGPALAHLREPAP